jgi:hypothetical protein
MEARQIVLIVNGKPEVGKDTFSENIKDIFTTNVNGRLIFQNISTIDHIKQIAKRQFGWDGIKDDKGRRLLSDLKDSSTRYNAGPFQHVVDIVDSFIALYENIPDCVFVTIVQSREPDEISKFVEYFKDICKTILIERDNDVNISNHADANVSDFAYDYILENNETLESFYESCELIVEDLKII